MILLITTFALVQNAVILYLLRLKTDLLKRLRYLKILVLAILLTLSIQYLIFAVLHDQVTFVRLQTFLPFCYGPLIFFQYRQFIGRPIRSARQQLIHLLPFIIGFFIYLSFLYTRLHVHNFPLFFRLIIGYRIAMSVSVLAYSGWILNRTQSLERPLKREFVLIRRISFVCILMVLSTWSTYLLTHYVLSIDPLAATFDYRTISFLCLAVIPFLILKYIFEETDPKTAPRKNPEPSYRKSGFNGELQEHGWTRLESAMQDRQLYLNSELTLEELSRHVHLSRQQVSQILSLKGDKNFYQYVNEYRVRELLRLLSEHPQERIHKLAEQAGFQSRTTLNTYFRKITGKSPTEYQEQLVGGPEPDKME